MPHRLQAVRSSLGEWAFWLWAVVGFGFGFAISVIGLVTVPASLIATIFLLTRPRLRASVYGVLAGSASHCCLLAMRPRVSRLT